MTEPIVLVSTHKIKEGKLDAFRKPSQEVAPLIEANKPQTIVFLGYVNKEGTEVTTVHVFPDAAGMELHMEGVGERAQRAAEFLEFDRLEVYGRPSERIVQAMKEAPGSALTLRIRPEFLYGYIRLGVAVG